jgi:hypothetical protein
MLYQPSNPDLNSLSDTGAIIAAAAKIAKPFTFMQFNP